MRNFIRFVALACIKLSGSVFYRCKLNWLSEKPKNWNSISLILVLNHTSLFEFIFQVFLPFSFLRELSRRLVLPIADVTMTKPYGRFILANLAPKSIGISRKRDGTWTKFLNSIEPNDICIFMPEGRMKRPSGLDKDGNPMTVRGGVYELLNCYPGREMLLVYSYGLHHVLAPGEWFPRLFQKVEAKVEVVKVDEYLKAFADKADAKEQICRDLERRRDQYCYPDETDARSI